MNLLHSSFDSNDQEGFTGAVRRHNAGVVASRKLNVKVLARIALVFVVAFCNTLVNDGFS